MFEAPAARKRMRSRLAAIQQASLDTAAQEEVVFLREEVLSQIPILNRLFLKFPVMTRLQVFLQQADMQITAGMLLLASLAAALLALIICVLFAITTVLLVVAVGLASGVPFLWVSIKRQRRFAKFEEAFPDAIDLLARAVRAGHAFTTGLELIAKEMPEPLATEFRLTYEQQNFGMPLREALHNMSVRVPLSDTRFFVTALQIQRESGGNLAEILDNLSYVIRERFKILRQVKVYTAQGRMTLYLLTGLPPVAALLLYAANPDYMSRLLAEPQPRVEFLFFDNLPLGPLLLAAAIVLQVIGYLVIRKIIRIRV
jgi:tight adherence protein B